ncbi:MAG: maleylpyruvate isomerase N-terminal domain-containing protein [Pseudonocardiaceae bacterium]
MSSRERELSWVADGQALFEQTVLELDGLGAPSRLPGWTRGHVVTHVTRGADGLCRLLAWARTGIETPMYPSVQARDADIEAGAPRPQAEQLEDLHRAGVAFAAAARELAPDHWAATVRIRRSSVPASFIPWARARELWLHLVDLDAGVEIDAMPGEIALMLVQNLADWMHTRVPIRIGLRSPGREPVAFGPGDGPPTVVSGSEQQLAAWLTGRSDGTRLTAPGGLPTLPPWL